MKTSQKDKVVPEQYEGTQKDIDYSVTAIDNNDAQNLFFMARHRLLDVNHWSEFSGAASSIFKLTDSDGHEVNRIAKKGDYFKIDIPAPGSVSGKGYDWVFIEAIEEIGDTEDLKQNIIMRVRPSKNPQDKGGKVAHFFSDDATSSFAIYRDGNTVLAAVHGRNEVANTDTANLFDKVRNTLVALTAKLGFSDVQWKSLVKGLVET